MNNRGIALFIVLAVASIMLVLGGAALSTSVVESSISQSFVRERQAFWAAEAGIQKAARALNDASLGPPEWNPLVPQGYVSTGNLATGAYTVQLSCTNCSNPVVTSVGVAGNARRTLVAKFNTQSFLTFGIFSNESLSWSGNGVIDSYDSSRVFRSSNQGVSGQGNIGSNGTSLGVISLSGNLLVNGNVSTGPGGTISKSDNVRINGTEFSGNSIILPPVRVPECLSGLPDAGNYSVAAEEGKSLSTGNYRYASLNISGNGQLNISGTVKIYLTDVSALSISGNGKVVIGGGGNLLIYSDGVCNIGGKGIVNNTRRPANFSLKSTYAGEQGVNISCSENLIGVIFAPAAGLTKTGNATISGAVVSKTAAFSGDGSFAYDLSLANVPGYAIFNLQNWSDENSPYPLI